MGDHRIGIKLQFSMHGVEKKLDWWLNWSDEIPQRLAEQVEEWKDLAMSKYQEEFFKAEELHQAEVEDAEREQLARLKAKYEPPSAS